MKPWRTPRQVKPSSVTTNTICKSPWCLPNVLWRPIIFNMLPIWRPWCFPNNDWLVGFSNMVLNGSFLNDVSKNPLLQFHFLGRWSRSLLCSRPAQPMDPGRGPIQDCLWHPGAKGITFGGPSCGRLELYKTSLCCHGSLHTFERWFLFVWICCDWIYSFNLACFVCKSLWPISFGL